MAHAWSDEHGVERLLPDEVWERIASGPCRLVILDYDGTLAPLRVERMLARPSPGMLAALMQLRDAPGTRLAVISGRPLGELRALLGGLDVCMYGEHGWDEWSPGFERVEHALEPEVARQLAHAAGVLPVPGDLVERKRCSIALHTRALDPAAAAEAEAAAEALWRPLEIPGLLRLESMEGGLELRASSRDKGVAAGELMRTSPADALVIALGDDSTDEAVFEEVAERGISIRVGNSPFRTSAPWRIESVDGVEAFLNILSRVVRDEGRGA